jgi:hypothetical protein
MLHTTFSCRRSTRWSDDSNQPVLRTAERADAELAELENLGVPHGDLGAGRAAHPDPHPADEILAEVDESPAPR